MTYQFHFYTFIPVNVYNNFIGENGEKLETVWVSMDT